MKMMAIQQKMINKRLVAALLSLLLCVTGTGAKADSFTSAELLAYTLAGGLQCLDWKLTGICVSLKCGITGCKIVTKPKIEHNLPDLVFSAFQQPGDNPWLEARLTHGAVAKAGLQALMSPYSPLTDSGDLSGANSKLKGAGQAVAFNDVHAVGNPHSVAITTALMGAPFLCQSRVKPLFPYMLTELDAIAWRFEEIEAGAHPASWIPGMREIGNWPLNTWGSIFPRVGSLHQVDPPKAAAVAVQRAADIVTQKKQLPHVYVPYPSEGNEETDWWQMISPVRTECEHFGAGGEWSLGKQSDDERFAWLYWRQYECCVPSGGILLFSIP